MAARDRRMRLPRRRRRLRDLRCRRRRDLRCRGRRARRALLAAENTQHQMRRRDRPDNPLRSLAASPHLAIVCFLLLCFVLVVSVFVYCVVLIVRPSKA